MISIIAAIGKNRELGKNNDLVFHIKEEFNRMIMDDYKYLLISEDNKKKLHLYTSDIPA